MGPDQEEEVEAENVLDRVAVESEAMRTKSLPVMPNEHSVEVGRERARARDCQSGLVLRSNTLPRIYALSLSLQVQE